MRKSASFVLLVALLLGLSLGAGRGRSPWS